MRVKQSLWRLLAECLGFAGLVMLAFVPAQARSKIIAKIKRFAFA
jgi:hypothetical protein